MRIRIPYLLPDHAGNRGPGAVMLVFGLILVVGGVWITLDVLYNVLEIDRSIPLAVQLGFGGAWIVVGLVTAGWGVVGIIKRRRGARLIDEDPDAPWRFDHDWDATGARDHVASGVAGVFVMAVILMVLLVPFNYLAFFTKQGRASLIFVVDVFAVALIGAGFHGSLRSVKCGNSSLRFNAFPFFLGERLSARFFAPDRLAGFRSMDITLRCVEERLEKYGDSKGNARCYQLYGDSVRIEGAGRDPGDLEIPIAFDLPADARPTSLSARLPVFWEIEIKADVPGIDYKRTFLVPVYARRTNPEHVP
jgi:hypothetical protein